MSEAVYLLCALTSVGCAVLLLRSWLVTRSRLLLWSTLCFAFLAVNNVLLFLDFVVYPNVDLFLWRSLSALIGISLLLYGLIWEAQ